MRPPASEYEGWCRRTVRPKTLHYYVRGVLLCKRYGDVLIRYYEHRDTDYLLDYFWDRRPAPQAGEAVCSKCLKALENRGEPADAQDGRIDA